MDENQPKQKTKKVRFVWEINLFNNFLFPAIISFTISLIGLTLALNWQSKKDNKDDRKKEAQYLNSLHSDLKNDLRQIDSILMVLTKTSSGLDSALDQMQKPMTSDSAIQLNYILIMKYDWFPPKVNFNEGTITQLKHIGGLNLITNPQIFDSIGVYDVGINLCQNDAAMVNDAYKETFSTQKYVYNYRDRLLFQDKIGVENSYELQNFSNAYLVEQMDDNIKLATTDKFKIIACYNDFANYQAALELYFKSLQRQREITKNLSTLVADARVN